MPGEAARVGVGALVAQDIYEHAIAPFGMQPVDRCRLEAVAIAQECPMLEWGTVVEVRPIAADCPTLQRARQVVAQELAPATA